MTSPYLGLDIGLRHTGIALSESGLVAQPLEVVEADGPHQQALVRRVVDLVREHEIATLVMGIPYTSEGGVTAQAEKTEAVIDQIEAALHAAGLRPEIVRANEIGTSQDGKRLYPGISDHLAAATLILQEYLDGIGAA